MSASTVHHFTDTGRLPWILREGILRPGANRLGGFPEPDFLWATTSPIGDRTASASLDALRSGLVRFVRFTLRARDFESWPAITKAHPAWTPAQVARLEQAARGQSQPGDWRCRPLPLPREAWLEVATRGYVDKTWQPLDPHLKPTVLEPETLAVELKGKVYASKQVGTLFGATGYSVSVGERRVV